MKSKCLCKVLILFCALSMFGCANSEATGREAAASATTMTDSAEAKELADSKSEQEITAASYEAVISAEYMPVEEAYESLKDSVPADPNDASEPELQAFVQKLKDLMDCSGKFANKTESGNRYSADVSFYLSFGKIFSTVSYSGYRGEIKDGEVVDTTEDGYLFTSEPKGDLYGREQDFHLYFGKEYLHIMWADTCDYVLDRGDGSAESVEDYKVPFDQTETFEKIVELVDDNFPNTEHRVVYDARNRELNLYFQAPDGLRAALATKNSDLMESWKGIVETMQTFSETLLTVVQIGGKAYHVNIFWVDQLNSGNEYTDSDYIVWVRDGTVKFNYADESGKVSGSSGTGTGSVAGLGNGSGVGGSGAGSDYGTYGSSHTPTRGEANALEKAHQYLNYTAFSYSGLISQLEYEGYSHTEAVYAADNCGADWNQQAVMKAEQYLDYTSFSKSGLIEQLEYEGFTHEQAEYAVSVVY